MKGLGHKVELSMRRTKHSELMLSSSKVQRLAQVSSSKDGFREKRRSPYGTNRGTN